jgi:hypothetical protein
MTDAGTAEIDRLYGLPLDEFVAARNAAAKEATTAGDKDRSARLRALAKPTVAAWVVNRAVRELPDDALPLFRLGGELRAASAARDQPRVRELDRERRHLLDGLLDAIRSTIRPGGRAPSDGVLRTVRETFVAAVADSDAADAVRAGRLTRGLEYVGFGLVDETGEAVDAESQHATARERTPDEGTERDVAEAEAEVDRLEGELDRAQRATRERSVALGDVEAEVERLDHRVAALRRELDAASSEHETRAAAATRARTDLADAEDQASKLEAALRQAEGRAADARRRRRSITRGA